MGWIDEDKEELKRRQQWEAEQNSRNRTIASEAETVYNDLWGQIVADIAEGKSKGIPQLPLITNGSAFKRVVIVPRLPKPPKSNATPLRVTVDLASDKLAIVVGGREDGLLCFSLDLDEAGVVHLSHNGEAILIGNAAKLILRPYLFPDLFRQP